MIKETKRGFIYSPFKNKLTKEIPYWYKASPHILNKSQDGLGVGCPHFSTSYFVLDFLLFNLEIIVMVLLIIFYLI